MRILHVALVVPFLVVATNWIVAPAYAQAPQAARVLAPGDMAPDFTLPGSDGRTYRLSSYRGKQVVVLAWFAKAFTTG